MTPRSDEAEALLARLHNNHVHKFVARSDEELHAHIAAAIDAARVPWERGDALRRDIAASCGDDDDDLARPRQCRRVDSASARSPRCARLLVKLVPITSSSMAL
jgi:hypothetical protein